MDLRPGLLVTRNVKLRRPLGEGGMGTVWVGDHLALDTQVAVKFIAPELSKDDPEILGRFQREAKVAAQIKSQHVVQVFDHGVMEDGTPFIVMELLDGSSLAEWLALTGTLSPEETATMVSQVAGVLGKAHELGIIHRDIKPENVFLVDSEDRLFAKVLDFGIAKQTRLPPGSMKTGTGLLVGTPDYMSPEQLLRAAEVDHRADLWALAVVAYRALTGRCPFEGETVPAVIVAITDGAFPPPSRVSSQPLSRALDAWFARALNPDPKARFESARELAESLSAAARAAVPVAGSSAAASSNATAQTRRVPAAFEGELHIEPRKAPPRRRAAPVAAARTERAPEPAVPKSPARVAPAAARPPPRKPKPQPEPKASPEPQRPASSRSALAIDLAAPVREPAVAGRRRVPEQDDNADSELAHTAAQIAPSALVVAAAGGVSYLLDPAGMLSLGSADPTQRFALPAAAAAALGIAAWRVAVAATRHAALSLWVACLGLGALGAGAAVTAWAMQGAGSGVRSMLPTVSQLAPLAAAIVAVAFGAFGIVRAAAELRGLRPGRRVRAAAMILLSLAALGLAYRVATRSPVVRDLVASWGAPEQGPSAPGAPSCAVEQVRQDLS